MVAVAEAVKNEPVDNITIIPAVLTPREIVSELDKHVVGQINAKKAVAIALRNRFRRQQLPKELRDEVTPKNILMIGPTGVGKTEIARRLAKLVGAPFLKVEATKFTEVGYVGRDVESIPRDLVDVAIKMTREVELAKVAPLAKNAAEERVLDALLPPQAKKPPVGFSNEPEQVDEKKINATREKFRKQLRDGELDDKEIEVHVSANAMGFEIMSPLGMPGMEEMTSQLQNIFQNLNSERKKTRTLKIKDALRILREEEALRLVDEDAIKSKALRNAEQNGIVFIDELDKVARRQEHGGGGEVSREGVQRDLLPLIEGCTVNTKYGMIKTDHILFIASGAFHLARPSDLIPELQGRLPIRVELKALSVEDFVCILTEPNASLTEQYVALMQTEGVKLKFTKDGIQKIAEIAWQVNERQENIGARRLHTVLERLLEEVSYSAPDMQNKTVTVNASYVMKHVGNLAKDEDLSQYIL